MSEYWKEFTGAADVYEQSYRLLRDFWNSETRSLIPDRKRALRQLRENNPAAYQAAFRSFWETKRDMRRRRALKKLWQQARYEEWKLAHPHTYEPMPPAPFSPEHVRLWLIEKGLIPKDAQF